MVLKSGLKEGVKGPVMKNLTKRRKIGRFLNARSERK